MTSSLTAEGLGKRYGATWALRDCDLQLPTGAVIALVGPNGAGKSTLLQLAAGLVRPTTGAVRLFDEQLPAGSREALAQLGFVAQDHPLYPRFRVKELFRMGAELNVTWDGQVAADRVVQLGIPPDRRVGALSGESRRRSLSRLPWPSAPGCSSSTSRWPAWTRWRAESSCRC